MNIINTIEKHQNGIIGTLMIHIIIFIWLNLNNVSYVVLQPIEKTVATLDFTQEDDNEDDDDENEEEGEKNKEINNKTNLINAISNENKEIIEKAEKFNTEKTDQKIYDELKAFETKEMEKLSLDNPELNSNKESTTTSEVNINVSNETVKISNATAKYDLLGRDPIDQKIPTFVCKESGTVRLTVKVNKEGEVTYCEINQEYTKTTNECLLKNAKTYAKKWLFNPDYNLSSKTNGWIEFVYLAQ